MRSQVESGTELLARLNRKPSLHGLDSNLFQDGPRNADVIEIAGEQSTGKTLLLSQMLAKCILPRYHRTAFIDGCNASAILINTDHHFHPTKMLELMREIVSTASEATSFASVAGETDAHDENLVRNCLRNLRVVNCFDSEQLSLTISTLEEIFLDDARISLLAIDSLTAYYWQDHENSIATIDAYTRKLCKLIKSQTVRHDIVTIYTRLCQTATGKRLVNQFRNNSDYKVNLCRVQNSNDLLCTVETSNASKELRYRILANGIQWETNGGHR